MLFFYKILTSLAGNADCYVKNSEYIIDLMKDINLQNEDILASFDVVGPFTNVPVGEYIQITENKFCLGTTVLDRTFLHVDAVMELLDI
jgi:hypothetical protein